MRVSFRRYGKTPALCGGRWENRCMAGRWFEADPGVLFVAPMGAEPPDNSVIDGLFLYQWPSPWWPVGVTQPPLCGTSEFRTYGADPLADLISDYRWSFGPVLTDRIAERTTVAPLTGIRFVTGWEALDRRTRLVADRCTLTVDRQIRLEADPRCIGYSASTSEEHNAAFGR